MPKMKCTNKFLAGFLLGEINTLVKPSDQQPDKIEQYIKGIPVGCFLHHEQHVQAIRPPAAPRVRHQHRQSRVMAEVVITKREYVQQPDGENGPLKWCWVYHFSEVKLKHKGK
jgi:hypothetical protein